MSDLISRSTVIELFDWWEHEYDEIENYIINMRQDVLTLPTIDAEPVRHGRWIVRDNPGTGWYRITCSECGDDVTSTAPCIGFLPNAKVIWDYCPDCGAKMLDTLNEVTE